MPGRKRRRGGRRGRGAGGGAAAAAQPTRAGDERVLPEWRWRTFPVFAAFMAGLLVASIINGAPSNTAAAVVQIGALLGVSYALAHLFATNVIVAGRIRRRREAAAREPKRPAEEPEDEDWVEEIVHPEER